MPMSPAKAPAFCCLDGRHGGLPAEAAEHGLAGRPGRARGWPGPRCRRRPSSSGSAQRHDVVRPAPPRAARRRTPPGRCGARAAGRRSGAPVGVEHLVGGRERASTGCRRRSRPGRSSTRDADRALGGHAADGAVLELVAERRVGPGRAVGADDAEPEQQAPHGVVGRRRAAGRGRRWKWHDEHDCALKSGPSPSRPSVDAGAVTQLSLKKLLPTAKVRRCSPVEARARAARTRRVPATSTVASPPCAGQLGRGRRGRRRVVAAAGAGDEQRDGGGREQQRGSARPHGIGSPSDRRG